MKVPFACSVQPAVRVAWSCRDVNYHLRQRSALSARALRVVHSNINEVPTGRGRRGFRDDRKSLSPRGVCRRHSGIPA